MKWVGVVLQKLMMEEREFEGFGRIEEGGVAGRVKFHAISWIR